MQFSLFDISPDDVEQFKALFDAHEWARIEDRVHYVIRDRRIKENFKVMKANGIRYDQAIRELSRVFFLSESQISHIVYPRKRRKKCR